MAGSVPPPIGEALWYYAQGDQRMGPLPASALQNLVISGTIRTDTQVWREGMASWMPAGAMPEFATAFGNASPGKRDAGLGLTQNGLIVFIVLLLFCLPLCWLPWVIKDLKARP